SSGKPPGRARGLPPLMTAAGALQLRLARPAGWRNNVADGAPDREHPGKDALMPRTTKPPAFETIADLLEQLGGIAPHRVRLQPPPGQATERDLLELNARTNRLYELVDGVLVEKVMGYAEGALAAWLIYLLQAFL